MSNIDLVFDHMGATAIPPTCSGQLTPRASVVPMVPMHAAKPSHHPEESPPHHVESALELPPHPQSPGSYPRPCIGSTSTS